MIGFLIGVLISVVAAAPALLLMWGGKNTDMKQRLKIWALGFFLRFAVIGGSLYFLFTLTAIERIPTVIGVALAYFALFILEVKWTLRT